MYFLDNDDVIKQKIVAELNNYVMSQKQVADYLDISTQSMSNLIRERKIEPLFIFNESDTSTRKINLFYKKDIEDYMQKLNAYRELRKK
ncbi:helix-turn-helix domain-containing protein [Listeria monocytogenes]|nr:helix-turn-helix domain-containing protein [Listeria monocytogenes]EEU7817563.1 helix-turn-helix domain-containing protein [Listeria monocytogenes]